MCNNAYPDYITGSLAIYRARLKKNHFSQIISDFTFYVDSPCHPDRPMKAMNKCHMLITR